MFILQQHEVVSVWIHKNVFIFGIDQLFKNVFPPQKRHLTQVSHIDHIEVRLEVARTRALGMVTGHTGVALKHCGTGVTAHLLGTALGTPMNENHHSVSLRDVTTVASPRNRNELAPRVARITETLR